MYFFLLFYDSLFLQSKFFLEPTKKWERRRRRQVVISVKDFYFSSISSCQQSKPTNEPTLLFLRPRKKHIMIRSRKREEWVCFCFEKKRRKEEVFLSLILLLCSLARSKSDKLLKGRRNKTFNFSSENAIIPSRIFSFALRHSLWLLFQAKLRIGCLLLYSCTVQYCCCTVLYVAFSLAGWLYPFPLFFLLKRFFSSQIAIYCAALQLLWNYWEESHAPYLRPYLLTHSNIQDYLIYV